MTSYMTCAPTVFVVIMIREINSKDKQGNDGIIAIHNNHDATQQLKHLSIRSRRPYNILRPLAIAAAAAAAEQFFRKNS